MSDWKKELQRVLSELTDFQLVELRVMVDEELASRLVEPEVDFQIDEDPTCSSDERPSGQEEFVLAKKPGPKPQS